MFIKDWSCDVRLTLEELLNLLEKFLERNTLEKRCLWSNKKLFKETSDQTHFNNVFQIFPQTCLKPFQSWSFWRQVIAYMGRRSEACWMRRWLSCTPTWMGVSLTLPGCCQAGCLCQASGTSTNRGSNFSILSKHHCCLDCPPIPTTSL